ncbi:MAG TPA: hypothetical protein VMM93_07665 [Vicinamibacterales bacterium]|nr:hypothetical protein [Vicinamibacterales bacterium]
MIRNLRAFVWLRWRLLANSLRGGRKRDRLEEISRVLSMALPILLVAMAFGSLVGLVILGFAGGRALAAGTAPVPVTLLVLRGGLFVLILLLVGFSVTSPVQGSLTRYTRLLLLPISRRMLHGIEVAASLADPWIAFLAPGLLMFAVGLAVGGRSFAAVWAALAALAFLAVLATLAACVGFLVAWLLRDRRRSEWFALIFVVGMSSIGFLPMYFAEQSAAERREARRSGAPRSSTSVADIERAIPAWTVAVPSELFGRAVRAGLNGDGRTAGLAVAGLATEAMLLFAVSSTVHARLIGSTTVNTRRRQGAARRGTVRTVPGLSVAASAVALAQARTMFRSVRGRLVVFMSGPLLAVMVFLFRRFEDIDIFQRLGEYGYVLAAAGSAMAVLSAQPITMNLFGSDRAGLTLQLLSPVSDADLARGKIVGVGLVLLLAMALSLAAAVVVAPGGPVGLWLAGQLGAMSVYLILAPAAVWLSALFPVASDLNRTGSAGNPHGLAGLSSVVILAVGLAMTAGVFWLATSYFGQPGLTLAVMTLWLCVIAAIALPLVTFASRTITLRRENLALVAQGK